MQEGDHHVRISLGSLRGSFGVHSGSVRDSFGVRSGCVRGAFGVRSGSVRNPFGPRNGKRQSTIEANLPREAVNYESEMWVDKVQPKINDGLLLELRSDDIMISQQSFDCAVEEAANKYIPRGIQKSLAFHYFWRGDPIKFLFESGSKHFFQIQTLLLLDIFMSHNFQKSSPSVKQNQKHC